MKRHRERHQEIVVPKELMPGLRSEERLGDGSVKKNKCEGHKEENLRRRE